MREVDQPSLESAFAVYGDARFTVLDSESPRHPRMPASWSIISNSADPDERRSSALDMWDPQFLATVPRFANGFRRSLLDVRVISTPDDGPMLVYACGNDATIDAVWLGWSPPAFGDDVPEFFQSFPEEAQTFFRHVHAGFAAPDAESCGLTPIGFMTTLAEWAEEPGGIPGWENNEWHDCEPIDSRRLLRVTGYGGSSSLCVSPDLPAGEALTYSDGEIRTGSFGDELDWMMVAPIEQYSEAAPPM